MVETIDQPTKPAPSYVDIPESVRDLAESSKPKKVGLNDDEADLRLSTSRRFELNTSERRKVDLQHDRPRSSKCRKTCGG